MARNVQEFIIYYLVPPLAMMVVSFPKLCTNQVPTELVSRCPLPAFLPPSVIHSRSLPAGGRPAGATEGVA